MNYKIALVTSASSGIGKAIAESLSKRGVRLILIARRHDKLELLKRELQTNTKCHVIACDVADKERIFQEITNLPVEFAKIDVLINSAGHGPKGEILKLSDEDWIKGMEVYFLNVVRAARVITPIMQKQKNGSIINISTFAIFEPDSNFPTSGAFRSSLAAFTKIYSDKYAIDNIRMNNILPGFIDSLPAKEEFLKKIPLKRYGKVSEISSVVEMLASEGGAYITGQNIRVDGGITRSV